MGTLSIAMQFSWKETTNTMQNTVFVQHAHYISIGMSSTGLNFPHYMSAELEFNNFAPVVFVAKQRGSLLLLHTSRAKPKRNVAPNVMSPQFAFIPTYT